MAATHHLWRKQHPHHVGGHSQVLKTAGKGDTWELDTGEEDAPKTCIVSYLFFYTLYL